MNMQPQIQLLFNEFSSTPGVNIFLNNDNLKTLKLCLITLKYKTANMNLSNNCLCNKFEKAEHTTAF